MVSQLSAVTADAWEDSRTAVAAWFRSTFPASTEAEQRVRPLIRILGG